MGANCNRNSNIIIFTICLLFICVGNIHSQISVPNPSIDLHLDLEMWNMNLLSKKSGA